MEASLFPPPKRIALWLAYLSPTADATPECHCQVERGLVGACGSRRGHLGSESVWEVHQPFRQEPYSTGRGFQTFQQPRCRESVLQWCRPGIMFRRQWCSVSYWHRSIVCERRSRVRTRGGKLSYLRWATARIGRIRRWKQFVVFGRK